MPTENGDQPTYRILDSRGRPIGHMRGAGDALPLGRGAGTVLLIRDRRTAASGGGTGSAPPSCGD